MADSTSPPSSSSEPNQIRTGASASTAASQSVTTPSPAAVANEVPVDVKQLTPEEQMALFEKDLKENDWGHQPC